MADAVGLTASIVAILKLSQTVVKYLNDVKDASKERNRILLEISSITGILFSLKDLAALDVKWLNTVKALAVPNGPLEMFQTALETLVKKLEPAVGVKGIQKTLAWSFERREVKNALAIIEHQKTVFILALQNDQIGLSKAVECDVAEIKHGVVDSTESRILDWLSQSQSEKKHADVCSQRLPLTGTWLLERIEFRRWRDVQQSPGLLWCHGIPGAGKTVLLSLVAEHLKAHFAGQDVGVAYYYCDYRDQKMQSTSNITASILKQISSQRPALPHSVIELYEQYKSKRVELIMGDLLATIVESSKQFNRTFVLIDALDECDAARHRKSLLKVLKDLEKASIRIFVTSRPHPNDIRRSLGDFPQIVIEASDSDIRLFLAKKIDQDEDAADLVDHSLREEIIVTITQGAQGMFLLPALQIQFILEQTSRAEIRQAIKSLPVELNKNFEATLARIQRLPESRSSIAMKTLMWISYSRRPLMVEELRHALAVQLSDADLDHDNLRPIKFMVDFCLGLVSIDHESATVRLVHYTLQEYFQNQRRLIFPLGDAMICQTCLTYLSFDAFSQGPCDNEEDLERRVRLYPFLLYAAKYWAIHAWEDTESQIAPLTRQFVDDQLKVDSSTQLSMTFHSYSTKGLKIAARPYTRSLTGLHIGAEWGLENLTRLLIQNGANLESTDSLGWTALHAAVYRGEGGIARLLVQHGANINAKTEADETPLDLNLRHEYMNETRMTRFLLEEGADITFRRGPHALLSAVRVDDQALVQLLLDRGADVNGGKYYSIDSPLRYAAENGFIGMVRLLLESGGDIDSSFYDHTALHDAAENGYKEVVQLLLENGAKLNVRTSLGETPLHKAAEALENGIVRLLLDNGANVYAVTVDGLTALDMAVWRYSLDDFMVETQILTIVELLRAENLPLHRN